MRDVLPVRLIGRRRWATESRRAARDKRRSAPENRRPDADQGGALLDGDLEVVAHPHRQLAGASSASTPRASRRSRTSAARGKTAATASGSSTAGGSSISPTSANRAQRAGGLEDRRPAPSSRAPCLVASPARSTWTSSSTRRVRRAARLRRASRPAPALSIEWTTSKRAGLLRLVGLQMSDEMPPERQIRGLVHLRQRFLDLVFAEVDLAGIGGGANVVSGERLRDGDEADGGGVAPGPAGRPRDARADVGQPGAERDGVDHYFFSVAEDPLRGGGVRSVRRELQVGLELGRGAGEVALVHQRHAELIVRFGVIRVRGDRAFELLLRVGDLAGVPEDDALVEQRVGVAAAAAPRAARRRSTPSPSRWRPPPRRTCAARCRCWRVRCRPRRSRP